MVTREYWRLEGYDITGTEVTSFPVKGDTRKRRNVARHARPGTDPSIQNVSNDVTIREFTFVFLRPGTTGDHYTVLRETVDQLEDRDVIYIHSPNRANAARAYLDEYVVWVMPESITQPEEQGANRLVLNFSAVVLGIPIVYGGTAYRPESGTMEKTATGWKRGDGVEYTSAEGPRVRMPEQTSGYPKFIRVSDLTEVVPTLDATEIETSSTEGSRVWHYYDLTGFLHPAPSATGDIGLYKGKDSPTKGWFEWVAPDGLNGGMVTFLSNDYSLTDSSGAGAAYAGLPQQATGYPKATDPTDLSIDDLTPFAEFTAIKPDGTTGVSEIYNVLAYVNSAPLAVGETGTWYWETSAA